MKITRLTIWLVIFWGVVEFPLHVFGQTEPKNSTTNEVGNISDTSNTTPSWSVPIEWLIAHREVWPKEVIINEKVDFPIVIGGKVSGTITRLAGTHVLLVDVTNDSIIVQSGGCFAEIPIKSSDFIELAGSQIKSINLTPKKGLTNEPNLSSNNPTGDFDDEFKKIFAGNPVRSEKLSELFKKYPTQTTNALEGKEFVISGAVGRMLISGFGREAIVSLLKNSEILRIQQPIATLPRKYLPVSIDSQLYSTDFYIEDSVLYARSTPKASRNFSNDVKKKKLFSVGDSFKEKVKMRTSSSSSISFVIL